MYIKIGENCCDHLVLPRLIDWACDMQARYLWGPRVLSFHYWGEAVAA